MATLTCDRSTCTDARCRGVAEIELILSAALLVTLFLMTFAAMRVRLAQSNVVESSQQQAFQQAVAGGSLRFPSLLNNNRLIVRPQVSTPSNVPPITSLPNEAYTGSARKNVRVFTGPDGWLRESRPGEGVIRIQLERRFQTMGPPWSIDGHAQPLSYRSRIRSWRTDLVDRNLRTLFDPLKLDKKD